MGAIRRFGHFWYDFFVGDDWGAAVSVAVALGVTAALATALNPWWLMPLATAAIVWLSVRRGARHLRPVSSPEPPDGH